MGNKEILYKGNSVITLERLEDYDNPVVVKRSSTSQYFTKHATVLENEFQSIQILKDIQGIRNCFELTTLEKQPALVLEYIDGETLNEHIARKTLDLRSKLVIAIDLARILKEIHQKNVNLLNFNSDHIIISPDNSLHLIDLGSATHIERSGQQRVNPDQILGALPYIAPEQTGRINRPVDERSDLYSLGVVLYELLTGQLPFDSKDPLELIHWHITRAPISPTKVSSDIPEVINDVILKLLSKNADDRYQSAEGILVDLETCLERMSPEDTIEEFQLGEDDHSSRLIFPQKLFGRDRELKELENAYESVCRETSSIVFVSGYSGIGKTALIEELQRPVSEKGGYFVRGKFDQYLRTTPYSAITQAFTELVSQILVEPEEYFSEWRDRIQSAVDDLGRVLTDAIPILDELIGAQSDVPELGGQEAENRFNYVFLNFISVIATSHHPLALFIDDLQWIDAASLRLLKVIQTEFDQPGLLVIGAYRDNEVDGSHPLMGIIGNGENKGLQLHRLKLFNLVHEHLEALLCDTLNSRKDNKALSKIIYDKTDGNPFFSRRLLSSLNEEGRIRFDAELSSWQWDIDDIKTAAISDNVADLLTKYIVQLPEETKNILELAACLGNRFDIPTLTLVSGYEEQKVVTQLTASSTGQYIFRSGEVYEFVHDQVHQAAYSLIDEESRQSKHLEIGRLLLADTDDTDLQDRIFDIATHYNLGANLLTNPAERLELVRLNLAAGRKARVAAAFAASALYLKQGCTLLGQGAWQDHYDLTLDIHSELIEVCYLNIQHADVVALFDAITENAKQDVDAGVAYKTLIISCVARHDLSRAISLAERYLEQLGVPLENERESDLTISELYELPQMENREKLVAMEILMAMTTPVLFSEPERLLSVFYTMLNLTRQHGNNIISAFAYAGYAYSLCLMQRYQEGNRFGQLVVDLLEKYPNPGRAAGIMNTLYTNVRHWRQPIHDQITSLKNCHRMAMQVGDFEYGLYSLLNYTYMLWGSGKPLEYCLEEVEPSISLCQNKNQQFALQSFLMVGEFVLNLTGMSSARTRLEGKWFSEETMMSRLEGNHQLLAIYGLLKMMLCYLFGDPRAAYQQTQYVLKYSGSLNPNYLYTKIPFYGALSCIAGIPEGESDADRQERLENLTLFEEELKLWAESAPMNYQHQYDLVMAEKCRISDRHWEAAQLYEKAIKGAQENRFVHEEALANELYACFWQEHDNDRIAEMYMSEARTLYQQWGAGAMVNHLERSYPQYFKKQSSSKFQDKVIGTDVEDNMTARPITPKQLDLNQITTASQILSSETNLETLLEKMMGFVISNSGAERVIFLLKDDDDWFIEAIGDAGSEEYEILLHKPFSITGNNFELIPESIFNYCCRTRENLVVENAMLDDRYAKDKAVQANSIKSLACIPIAGQGKSKALIYLENRTISDVFTPNRMEVLKHLSAQFGVSVENAILYENLNKKITALSESEERFRLVFDNASEAIAVTQDNVVKYCNPQITELSGYSKEEILSLNFTEFIHPDDVEMVMREYRSRLSGEKPKGSYTMRILTKQGREKFVFVNSTLINWEGQHGTLVLLTDITQLKKAESELKSSEERYKLAVSGAAVGIWDWDIVTNKLFTTTRLKELLGYESDEIDITMDDFYKWLHPEDFKTVQLSLEKHLKEHVEYDVDYRLLMKSGDYRWFHARGQALWNKAREAIRMSGSISDITQRKNAEEKLKGSESRFRQLMEQSPLAMEILSPDGKINVINSAWKKMWDIGDEEAAEIVEKYNMLTDPQLERLGILEEVKEAFAGKHTILPPIKYDNAQTVSDFDIKLVNEFISPWIQCHLNAVKDEKGEIVFIVNTYVDITNLRKAEEEAAEQRDVLARIDRASSMGQLTGSIAHELNQPLTGILGNAQAAEMMLKNNAFESSELLEIMGDIVADTKRAGNVIRNLRDLYKDQKSEFAIINVNTIVEETLLLLHSEFVKYNVKLKKITVAEIPEIDGNKVQIQQVLVNLMVNAIEAMSSIEAEPFDLSITTECDGKEVTLYIDDSGPGIDEDKIEHIFEPLATWKSGGTGMGLAISNSIIESHGGRMLAENLPGGGARVGFELPIINKNYIK